MATVCVVIFVGIHVTGVDKSWDSLARWGYPSASAIWDGAYWGLLTSAFVHIDPLHLFFNLYWLLALGGALEVAIGAPRFVGFVTAAAIVSSGVQLAFGDAGHGLSGVGYAIFGYVWLTRRDHADFERVLTNRTKWLFLYWLVGCAIATHLGMVSIGNAAHVAGLAFGASVAYVRPGRLQPLAVAALALLFATAMVPLFWCPWSKDWNADRAFQAHGRGDYTRAEDLYRRALRLGIDPVWGWQNLAFLYASAGRPKDVTRALEELRRLDPKKAEETSERLAAESPPEGH